MFYLLKVFQPINWCWCQTSITACGKILFWLICCCPSLHACLLTRSIALAGSLLGPVMYISKSIQKTMWKAYYYAVIQVGRSYFGWYAVDVPSSTLACSSDPSPLSSLGPLWYYARHHKGWTRKWNSRMWDFVQNLRISSFLLGTKIKTPANAMEGLSVHSPSFWLFCRPLSVSAK